MKAEDRIQRTAVRSQRSEAFRPRAVRARKVADRFSVTGVCRSPRGVEPLPPRRLRDSARGNVCRLRGRTGSRGLASAGANRAASSDQNGSLLGPAGRMFKALLAAVFEDEFNRGGEAFQTFFAGLSLPVGFRHFRAGGGEPFAVPLNDRRVAISHGCSLRDGRRTDKLKFRKGSGRV